MSTIHYGQVQSYFDTELIRELENGTDIRITEAGDIRVTGDTGVNISIGTLSATGSVLGFVNNAYVKYSGIWRTTDPYVKHNGSWKIPSAIYVKQSGSWRRVY
jgi:hypothetical protein